MQNPAVKSFRFIIWVTLMCAACLITTDVAPHKAVFIPSVLMVLFVPMVLLPVRNKRNGGSSV